MATLTVYRRKLAEMLGHPPPFTASSGSTSTLVSVAPFKSTLLPVTAFQQAWVFVPGGTGVRQRRIASIAPGTGTITLDDVLGGAVGTGTAFEIHPRMPAIGENLTSESEATTVSQHQCLNMALRHILVPDDSQTITLINGQRDYSVSGIVGLDRPGRLLDVRQPDALGTSYISTPKLYEFRESGAGNTLHFPAPFRFPSGSYTLKLVVERPADTLISGATSTVGLVNESDTAVPDVNAVATLALAFAYRALREARTGGARARWDALYEAQIRAGRRVKGYDHSNDLDPSVSADGPVAEAA